MIVKLVEELLSQGTAATLHPSQYYVAVIPWDVKKKWYPCRSKLFSHLEETGHAMLKTRHKNRRWGEILHGSEKHCKIIRFGASTSFLLNIPKQREY
jgi:hypothetical protein